MIDDARVIYLYKTILSKKMKITLSQLKRIIKEEVRRSLDEGVVNKVDGADSQPEAKTLDDVMTLLGGYKASDELNRAAAMAPGKPEEAKKEIKKAKSNVSAVSEFIISLKDEKAEIAYNTIVACLNKQGHDEQDKIDVENLKKASMYLEKLQVILNEKEAKGTKAESIKRRRRLLRNYI